MVTDNVGGAIANAITGGGGGEGGGSGFGLAGSGGGGGGLGVEFQGQVTDLDIDATVQGGDGGAGGASIDAAFPNSGFAGDGGAGGHGIVFTDDAANVSVNAVVSGGTGGGGGNGGFGGGGGGMGGTGIVAQVGSNITVKTAVSGGDGGAAGAGNTQNGVAGAGGAGLEGRNLSIILEASGSIAGGLSGDGVRANAITFTGGANTLSLDSSAPLLTGDIAVGGGGSLTFDQSNDVEVSSAITGNGSLSKKGSAAIKLSGTNTYSGATTVDAGTLEIAAGGSIVSDTTVNSGAFVVNGTAGEVAVNGGFLGGGGTVGATSVGAGGTLAPGNSIGTITVNGNLTFATGSTYAVEVSPSAADRTNVTGTADLTGGLVVTDYAPGAYIEKRYTILEASGGLGGTEFAGLTGDTPSGFEQELDYDADTAYLVLSLLMAGGPSAPGPWSSLTDNQQSVADTIVQHFETNGGILAIFGSLSPSGLTMVSGEVTTGAMGGGMDATGQFLNLIGDPDGGAGGAGGSAGDPLEYTAQAAARADMARRTGRPLSSTAALAALSGEAEDAAAKAADALALSSSHAVDNAFATRWHLWGAAYGGGEKVEGDATVIGSADLSARTWGLASGITRNFDGGRIGLALGGAGTSFSLAGGLGSGNATSFNAGLHGTGHFGDGYVTAALAYGYHATRTSRAVPGDTLSARFGAQTFGGRLEAGYRLTLGGVTLTPFAAAEATAYRLPGYTETSALGGPFALAYASQTETAIRTELGARTAIALGSNARLTGRAAWVWNADSARTVTAAFQALPGASFTINGAQPARHAALLEAGVEAAFGSVTAKVTATGEFSKNVTSFGAQAKVGFRW
ncbi:MAG: autotransporter domain-containing protein [Rhizobiaceae bacterium]